MKKDFDVYAILSVTHGLPIPWQPYQEILEHITCADLPSPLAAIPARTPARELLLEQHPALREIPPPPDFGDETAMDAWADAQKAVVGDTLPVTAMQPGQWAQPSDLDIVLDIVPADRVWMADPSKPDLGLGRTED